MKHHSAVTRVRARRQAPAARRVIAAFAVAATGFAALLLTGCGNEYRPVVSAINPVGPAGQPTKYAVAVSNPNPAVQESVASYSIANDVITVTAAGSIPLVAGQTVTLSGFPTSTFLNGQSLIVLANGLSATQFEANFAYANAAASESGTVSAVQGNIPALVTYVDFAGDTVLSTPNIQTNPNYFAITDNGSEGYTINAAGSLDSFALGNPTSVITSTIGQTTLAADANPVSISAVTPSGSTETLFITEPSSSNVAILSGAGTAPALLQDLAVSPNPVYVVGADGSPRVYAVSQGSGGSNGSIASIEAISTSSLAVSATIPVGIAPVYGVMTADDRRAFILNQGSGAVSVVNVVNNALDATDPTITLPAIPTSGGATTAPRPVWADLAAVNNELVVLNQGDGIHPGTLSIINIPLCSTAAQPSNPNCNLANPVDATGFGTFVATASVGINPTMVSVLHDGSAAYVINQGNPASSECNGQGSVSVVNLISGVVTSTICAVPTGTTSDGFIHGHPNSVSATTGNPTGKVYVTASDSNDLSVIYTDTNTVQTHINLQGKGLRVLVTSP